VAGEFDLIARYFDRGAARSALLGIGDDCALIAPPQAGQVMAVTTDMLLADRHFFSADPADTVGHKALAVNLSDLAAMGASPAFFTLAIALPRADEAWVAGFAKGLFRLADEHGCELIGGDTTRGPLSISITAMGWLPRDAALRRDAAELGDDIWVSGELGAAALAVHQALAGNRLPDGHPAMTRMLKPMPRVALGLALRHLARAAIDVSDGLLADLGHVVQRSRAGADLHWECIPVDPALTQESPASQQKLALSGGDDYELLFTAAPENRPAIEAIGPRLGLRLSRIGSIRAGSGVRVLDQRGRAVSVARGGFDHFA
jgi:thiamine-monophosphate kinase